MYRPQYLIHPNRRVQVRKEYAIFSGRKLVAKFWTEEEASQQLQDGQHVRRWNWDWSRRASWVSIDKWGKE